MRRLLILVCLLSCRSASRTTVSAFSPSFRRVSTLTPSTTKPPSRSQLQAAPLLVDWYTIPFQETSRLLETSTSIIMASAASTTDVPPDTNADATLLANALGYLIGVASLLLYTPIAIRVFRQKSANGTTMTTWWLKLASYTCNDMYAFVKGYPLSTYVETLIITVEAAIILCLVTYYQQRQNVTFYSGLLVFVTLAIWLLTSAPPTVIAGGQLLASALNSGALLPQFILNYQQQTKGDYSPVTAGLAASGCAIRLFTIVQLAGSDPILLFSFGMALVLNTLLCLQILYYGVVVEGLSLREVLAADWADEDVEAEDDDFRPVMRSKKDSDEDAEQMLLAPQENENPTPLSDDQLVELSPVSITRR